MKGFLMATDISIKTEPDKQKKPTSGKAGIFARMSGLRAMLALVAVLILWLAYPPPRGTAETTSVPFNWVYQYATGDENAMENIMAPWESKTFIDILKEGSVRGLLAVGMTLVIIAGGIDLSVGSMLGMCGVFFALFTLPYGMDPILALLATVGIGAVFGIVSGLWVVNLRIGLPLLTALGLPLIALGKDWPMLLPSLAGVGIGVALYFGHNRLKLGYKMQPFAATLAMMVVARGVAKLFSGGKKILQPNCPDFYDQMAMGYKIDLGDYHLMIPPMLVFVFLSTVLCAWLIMRFTPFGRHVYAVGGNAEAARLSGIRVKTVITTTFMICGITAALAGIGQTSLLRLGNPDAGVGYELDAIAAVVLGGTSLMGGRGGVLLTLLGVLILGFLQKYLSLHGWEEWARLVAKGAIIVVAVAMQRHSK